jgi:hypothetical protein
MPARLECGVTGANAPIDANLIAQRVYLAGQGPCLSSIEVKT